jgi:pyruvate dehydrogenase E2 component (dihydrolipoamide acetyltransferase)
MAEKFLMPKLSPTMEEGQIARWLKKEGEAFKNGDTLAEVDTDKATMEMTALSDGVLLKILKGDGETVPLGDAIAITGKEGEDIAALLAELGGGNGASAPKQEAEQKIEPSPEQKPAAQPAAPQAEKTAAQTGGIQGDVSETAGRSYDYETRPGSAEQAQTKSESPQSESRNPQSNGGRLIISPIAARMSAEAGLDLNSLQGSGPGGRIIKRDIEQAIENRKAQPQVQPAAPEPQIQEEQTQLAPAFQTAEIIGASPFRDEPTTQMRRTIASRLVTSIGPVPTFYLTIEIEMDKAIDLRKQINAALPEEKKVSINDVIVKTVASALMQHPQVNASYQDRTIRYFERADIGVAVAIPDGLITPIVRNANSKGIAQIAAEVKELAGRAREKKLKPEEFTGGTFSISNLGMFGIEEFTAIINPPEAGILAIGKSEPKPVVRDGEITVRNMMRVTMSCDHRVIDGATGAQFLKTLKQMLENPLLMIM